MATLKIVQASDVHDDDDFSKYQTLRDIVKSSKPDALFLIGDFFGTQELIPVQMVRRQSVQRFTHWVEAKDRDLLRTYSQVSQYGGIDILKMILRDPAIQDRERELLEKLVKKYESQKSEIEKAAKVYESLSKFNERWTNADLKDLKKELDEEAFYRHKKLDRILGEMKCPVYAVRGNWERDYVYEHKWKNLKFVEKMDNLTLKGMNVAAAPNWYERLGGMPDDWYAKAEKDPAFGASEQGLGTEFEEMLARNGTPQEKRDFERGIIPERFLANNETHKRLKDKSIDILLTHKGPNQLSVETQDGNEVSYGSGIGTEAICRKKKVPIILGGHIHGDGAVESLEFPDYKAQGVRSTDKHIYELNIDTDQKRIVSINQRPYLKESRKAA